MTVLYRQVLFCGAMTASTVWLHYRKPSIALTGVGCRNSRNSRIRRHSRNSNKQQEHQE